MGGKSQQRRSRHAQRLLLALIPLLAIAGSAAGDIFRWTDEHGNEHFTQDLEAVPAPHREAARARWEAANRRISVTGGGRPATRPADRASPGPAARPLSSPATPARRRSPHDAIDRPGGRVESEWRAELMRHEQSVASARRRIQQIEASSSAPGSVDYSRRGRRDKDRARWERGRQLRANQREKAKRVAVAQARLAAAEEALALFRERARRAGVPPGWLRTR